MGKKSPLSNSNLTFTPKISATSRKLAAVRRSTRVKLKSVPNKLLDNSQEDPFQHSKYKKLDRIPHQINPDLIDLSKDSKGRQTGMPTSVRGRSENGYLSEQGECDINRQSRPNSGASNKSSDTRLKKQHSGSRINVGYSVTKSAGNLFGKKQNEVNFSFQPELCATSTKIVENLGSNFMGRQQRLLDKKRKTMETSFQFRFHSLNQSGKLSPVTGKSKMESKEEPIAWGTPGPKTPEILDADKVESPAANEEGNMMSYSSPTLPVVAETREPAKSSSQVHLQRLLEGPYPHSNSNMLLRRQQTSLNNRGHKRHQTVPNSLPAQNGHSQVTLRDVDEEMPPDHIGHTRSKTLPPNAHHKHKGVKKLGIINLERLKNAKDLAEKSIKYRKIFTIQGPYAQVRERMRQRGWVEKFYKAPTAPTVKPKKKKRHSASDDDNDDDDDDDDGDDDDDAQQELENKIPPWEEEDGVYGIMSRIVRNSTPTFIWSLRRDTIDFRFLQKEQIVNHYCRAGSFTTKVGLCINMRNVPWYENANPDQFFPRCYRLSHEDEKQTFIDDFRLTACMNILKWVKLRHENGPCPDEPPSETTVTEGCTQPECTRSQPGSATPNKCIHMESKVDCETEGEAPETTPLSPGRKKKKKGQPVPERTLEVAIQQIEKFVDEKSDKFLDTFIEPHAMSEDDWCQFLQWYYAVVHDEAIIPRSADRIDEVNLLLEKVKPIVPQFELDGIKNVWIVKPGAKSRGRGIFCCNKLEEMTKLVSSSVVRKDSKFVVQKYIERPLLIYNTKFDIRQWFLVTDWNPLTFYFYKECYLRFCTQQYTLDNFDESIHLSNNAIQKNYDNQKGRPTELPSDNMWSSDDFIDYLKQSGHTTLWEDVIYPGMMKAIQCALAATQDVIEFRKNSFELYGADFMLTEDFQPWLIEINSSPSMCASTAVTARLCNNVLEDTLKVVLDRRIDKNADLGMFELACKQPQVTVPPYIGIDLTVQGSGVPKPIEARRRSLLTKSMDSKINENIQRVSDNSQKVNGDVKSSKTEPAVFRMTKAKKEIHEMSKSITDPTKSKETTPKKKSESDTNLLAPASSPIPPPPPPLSSDSSPKMSSKKSSKKSVTPVKGKPTTQIVLTNPWLSNSCAKCGCGQSLRLSTEMFNCQCRKDGIRLDMGEERQRPKTPAMITAHTRPIGLTLASGSGQSVNHYARNRVIQALVNSKEFDRKSLHHARTTSETLPYQFADGAFSNHHLPRLNKRFTGGHKKSSRSHAQKMFVVSNSYVGT